MAINLKGLTIKQPYAQLLATGEKRYETRSISTRYRGPVAIHAGADKSIVRRYTRGYLDWFKLGHDMRDLTLIDSFRFGYYSATALAKHYPFPPNDMNASRPGAIHGVESFAFGAVIAVGELTGCYPMDSVSPNMQELVFGDWSIGRYAWEIKNIYLLPEPIPYKGQLGLWNVSDDAYKLMTQSVRE